jgi:hypothetical protein
LGCYNNVLVTMKTNLSVYHEFKNWSKYREMPKWRAYVSTSAITCILFSFRGGNARKQASHPNLPTGVSLDSTVGERIANS